MEGKMKGKLSSLLFSFFISYLRGRQCDSRWVRLREITIVWLVPLQKKKGKERKLDTGPQAQTQKKDNRINILKYLAYGCELI